MVNKLKKYIKFKGYRLVKSLFPRIVLLEDTDVVFEDIKNCFFDSVVGKYSLLYPTYRCSNSTIGDYTYVAKNSNISMTKIGKFCSIGPNFLCGYGIHPTDNLSTHPMFYSTLHQNGVTLSDSNKIEERKEITIGNDVFIGANVIVLDGVTIGDGAVIGAGAVVSKNIPPYAVAVGCPIKIIKYRHSDKIIEQLLTIKWWDWEFDKLKEVETYFNDVEGFVRKWENNK